MRGGLVRGAPGASGVPDAFMSHAVSVLASDDPPGRRHQLVCQWTASRHTKDQRNHEDHDGNPTHSSRSSLDAKLNHEPAHSVLRCLSTELREVVLSAHPFPFASGGGGKGPV